jgi:diacylglycerol kinase family enzyme
LVVAVGGDGTLNEVAQGLLGTHLPMGIIPRGSGNGLARHLGIPLPSARRKRS